MRHATLSTLTAPVRGRQSRTRGTAHCALASPRAQSATAAPRAAVKFTKFQVRGAAAGFFALVLLHVWPSPLRLSCPPVPVVAPTPPAGPGHRLHPGGQPQCVGAVHEPRAGAWPPGVDGRCSTPATTAHPRLCRGGAQAVRLCDRNFGIGGDGVIFALRRREGGSDYSMRIFNSDGSEPEMCGNGIRCLARFVASLDGVTEKTYRIDTGAGVIVPDVRPDGQVSVDMGRPILEAPRVPCTLAPTHSTGAAVRAPLLVGGDTWRTTAVSMGNPHSVVFAMPDGSPINLDTLPLGAMGPSFEHHPAFPKRTNTEFVTVLSRGRLRMRVWERGAGATLACGTGACATVVAAVLEGLADRRCVVDLPGGPLDIHWRCAAHVTPVPFRCCLARN